MRQLVVLDLATDLSIGVACAAIAFALIHFARRPTVRPYGRVFVAFAVFVIADGATHLAAVWTLWQPSAWLATVLKLATALAAVAVALLLPPLVPKALAVGAASALLDAAPDAIILIDASGTIRLVNERAERLFGYPRRELLGQPSTLVLPDDVRVARDAERDVYGLRRDGSRFLAEVSLSPLVTDGGPLVTAVVRDVTDRRRLEDDRAERGRAEVARAHAEEVGRRASFLAEARAVGGARPDAGRRLVRPPERQARLHAGRPRPRRGPRPARGARRRQRAPLPRGAGREPGQGRVPRRPVPRAAHAAHPGAGLGADAAHGHAGAGGGGAGAGHRRAQHAPAGAAGRRPARRLTDHRGQAEPRSPPGRARPDRGRGHRGRRRLRRREIDRRHPPRGAEPAADRGRRQPAAAGRRQPRVERREVHARGRAGRGPGPSPGRGHPAPPG